MKLEIPIIVGFDDMESLLDDLKKLQTYKLFEGDEMVLVDIDDVADVLVKHIKAKEKQPEIIRCRDCKHYQFADNRAFGMPVKMCEWFGFEDVDDDDFCSRAERRTDE